MAPVTALCFNGQLFKQLIVACQETNLVGKVDTLTFMPLPHNLFTHIDMFQLFDAECHKVSQDSELVRPGACFVFFSVCL